MKILLDENVDYRIKDFLESKGLDVTTTGEEGLKSESDREVVEYSTERELAILTHDDDLISIARECESHPAIIFLSQRIRFREMKNRLSELEKVEAGEIVFP